MFSWTPQDRNDSGRIAAARPYATGTVFAGLAKQLGERRPSMQRILKAAIVAVVAVVISGLIDLAQPLAGDQSLFFVAAKEMANGAVLYRHFWDLKQPGIFDFYYVAGLIGGFSPVAVHALELAYLAAFAFLLTFALSRSRTFAAAAPFGAIFAIVWYYCIARPLEQLQVEALAGFPLFVTAWLACEAAPSTTRRRLAMFAIAGLAGAFAVLLKLMFFPLVLLFFVAAFAAPDARNRRSIGAVVSAAVAFAGGLAVPLGATLAVLAHGGALSKALDIWIVVPPEMIATLPVQDFSVLLGGIEWFVRAYAVPLVLACAGVFTIVRSRAADALAWCLALWLVVGSAIIFAQRTSWWNYQWLLLEVPVACFAAAGLAALLRAPRSRTSTAVLILSACLSLIVLRREVRNIVPLAQSRFAIAAADREAYRERVSTTYAQMHADRSLLPNGADVYVMGDPMYYVVTDRTQPLATNGWAFELLLPPQRAALLAEFRAHPPPYVYVSHDSSDLDKLLKRSPAFADYFVRHYRFVADGERGMFYRYAARSSQ